MSLHRACCCGALTGDCPCHSYYGGQATYTATWTGSVTATTPSCACMYSLYGPAPGDPAVVADKVDPTETWDASGYPVTVSWQSNNVLDPNFCKLVGSAAMSDITLQPVELYNGNCTNYGSSINNVTTLAITIYAPDPDSGRNYWEAYCSMTAMLSVVFRSTQSTCFPTVWSVYSVLSAPPSGCNDWRGMASWSHSVGTFSLT